MILTVLVDNNTIIDRYFLGEPGVSYLIQDGATQVLFDVGYSDAFITNARKMEVDVLRSDFVVLSHGHIDHTGGLAPLLKLHAKGAPGSAPIKKPALIAHPDVFHRKSIEGRGEIGCAAPESSLRAHFDLTLSKSPFWISDRLVFLGEIERGNDFENKESVGEVHGVEGLSPDFMLDDSALAYQGEEGLVIITGCSHSGICNIIEYAQQVCGRDRVVDVIGGFHLLRPSQHPMDRTLEYFRRLKPDAVHACHCVDLDSKIALSKVCKLEEVGVGLSIEYK